MSESYDYVLRIALVNLEEFAIIDYATYYLVHIVRLVRAVRNDVIEGIVNPSCGVIGRNEWCLFPVVRRYETEKFLYNLNAFLFILCSKMCNTAFRCVNTCTSEFFLAYRLTCDRLDNSRTGKEHIGCVLNHDVEVSQGRGVNCSTCARTEDSGNLRNNSRREDIPFEDFSKACQ